MVSLCPPPQSVTPPPTPLSPLLPPRPMPFSSLSLFVSIFIYLSPRVYRSGSVCSLSLSLSLPSFLPPTPTHILPSSLLLLTFPVIYQYIYVCILYHAYTNKLPQSMTLSQQIVHQEIVKSQSLQAKIVSAPWPTNPSSLS
jgi:hypothetical protein